ncbi:MAG: hypothetical protein ACK4TA_06765 [Saprospiraceae bacterium]
MKENIPGDNLESFLQHAFESYAESPSEEMWERIAADVKAPPAGRWVWRLPYQVWIGAAAALLTGLVIYYVIHFNQRLDYINRSVEAQQTEIKALQKQEQLQHNQQDTSMDIPQASIENGKGDVMNNEGMNNEGMSNEGVNNDGMNNNVKLKEKSKDVMQIAANKQSTTPIHPTQLANGSTNTYHKNNANFIVASPINQSNPPLLNKTIHSPSSIPAVGAPLQGASLPAVANGATVNDFNVIHLATKENQILFTKNQEIITIPPALELPIQRARTKTGFYAGVQAMAMKNWSKIKINDPRPMPPHNRKEFNQPDVNQGNTLAFGVNIGNKIGKQLSLEAGLLYRSSASTATHQPKFKFHERKLPPQGGPRDCQFEYDLNTPSGTVALAISVENTALATPEEEEIALEITANQSLTYLSIPLLLNYQIGNNKLHLNAKGGVLTNFLLENDFNITNIHSNNINFRPQPNQPLRNEPLYINQLSLDYLLQVGLAYDVTPNLSVNVSPTLIGSLSNQSANRFVQSSSYSAGLSAGLTWGF